MEKTLEEWEENEKNNDEKDLGIWDLGSPLYDSYEVVSLTHLIERHFMALPSLGSRRLSLKLFPPPFSVPAATHDVTSDAKGTHDRSSLAKILSEFVRSRLWKNGVDKPKKVKVGVVRGFCNRFCL